jgi:hypothetical protein
VSQSLLTRFYPSFVHRYKIWLWKTKHYPDHCGFSLINSQRYKIPRLWIRNYEGITLIFPDRPACDSPKLHYHLYNLLLGGVESIPMVAM